MVVNSQLLTLIVDCWLWPASHCNQPTIRNQFSGVTRLVGNFWNIPWNILWKNQLEIDLSSHDFSDLVCHELRIGIFTFLLIENGLSGCRIEKYRKVPYVYFLCRTCLWCLFLILEFDLSTCFLKLALTELLERCLQHSWSWCIWSYGCSFLDLARSPLLMKWESSLLGCWLIWAREMLWRVCNKDF